MKFMVIHEQFHNQASKVTRIKPGALVHESLYLCVRCAKPFIFVSIRGLEFLFYFHVEIPAVGISGRRIEAIAFVGEWWIGIEDVVNTER